MSKIVLVPVSLDALYLKYATSVAHAKVDFSRLPFCDGKRDWYADTVNLSESIISQPFQNPNLHLKPGIHLHWALPDTLTKGKHTDVGVTYPAVPNRWLVIRKGEGVPEEKWLIESDYLYPPEAGYQEDSVTYPIRYPYGGAENAERRRKSPPFCYLGRNFLWSEWQSKRRTEDRYLEPLTAIGYGESTFAAFYPNCLSVFGFRDDKYAGDQPIPKGLQYDLIGWYDKPNQDYLREFVEQFAKNHQGKVQVPTAEELTEELQWQGIKLDGDSEVSLICYARIKFQPNDVSSPVQSEAKVELAVGNTGIEALVAYLAEKIAKDNGEVKKAIAEEQLAAMYFADNLKNRQLDVGAKFQELRHEASFNGVSAGILWEIRTETHSSTNSQQSQSEASQLPTEITHLLHQVNQEQQKYNRDQEKIVSRQRQLFSDWYKYMVSTYPPEASWDNYPDIDEVKSYIEKQEIEPLDKIINKTGELTWKIDKLGKIISAAVRQGETESIASKLAKAINELIAKIKNYNETISKEYKGKPITTYNLERVAAPRYWQPKEPVVLLAGVGDDILKSTKRHGQDGTLTCHILNAETIESLIQNQFISVIKAIDDIDKENKNHIGFTTWENQPWNPILLEWLAEVFPLKNPDGTSNNRYASDFITNKYVLTEQGVELSNKEDYPPQDSGEKKSSIPTAKDFNIYSGSTILTSYAGKLLNERINKYLSENFPNPTGEVTFNNTQALLKRFSDDGSRQSDKLPKTNENPILQVMRDYESALKRGEEDKKIEGYLRQNISKDYPEYAQAVRIENSRYLSNSNNINKLIGWYEKSNQEKRIPNLLYTAILAYEQLNKLNCLSQSLGGFNEALLMQKQTMQLAIEEPITFSAYQKFTTQVQKIVGNQNCTAPQPLNDFRPLRTGELQIISLQLVDTFGQIRQLNWKQRISNSNTEQKEVVIVPEKMKANTGNNKTTIANNRIIIPPRLVQPSQINFRWLSGSDHPNQEDNQKTNVDIDNSPILGWIIFNNINESLLIFNSRGKALGSLEPRENSVSWICAPGETAISEIGLISNVHLRKVVQQIKKLSEKQEKQNFFTEFKQVITNALENIEPENNLQPPPQALFIGRPIAIVRAEVSLELQGIPAINQNWQVFRKEMQVETPIEQRETNDFTKVEFPIRIGEFQHLNDGLIGYWLETEEGKDYKYEKDIFYASQSDSSESKYIETQFWDSTNNPKDVAEEPINIMQSISKQPQKLTMLLDPRGEVHVTCGILPTKAIRIPPEQYITVLESIEVAFFTSPVLMEHNKYPLPLMTVPEYDWSWLEKHGDSWDKVYSQSAVDKQDFIDEWSKEWLKWLEENPKGVANSLEVDKNNRPKEAAKDKGLEYWQGLIDQKWLKPIINNSSQKEIAYITLPLSDSKTEPEKHQALLLKDDLRDKDIPIRRVLDRCGFSLTAAISEANFSGNQEVREGWLILSRTQNQEI